MKVIFETDALTLDEIAAATDSAVAAGADFTKTSTGFYTGTMMHGEGKAGAFPEMVDWMIKCADGRAKVKGSGSIRNREYFLELIDKGIDRMGVGYKSTPVVLGLDGAAAQPAGGGY